MRVCRPHVFGISIMRFHQGLQFHVKI